MQEKPRLRLVPAHQAANLEKTPQALSAEKCGGPDEKEVDTLPLDGPGGPVTIDLGASDIAALKRILRSLAKDVAHSNISSDGKAEKEIAQLIFNLRKARALLFPVSMFSEPAWDIMLALYIANQAPTAADLARWTNTPLTTATRWIAYLEDHNLVARESSAEDRRVQRIRMTQQARAKMQELFSEFLVNYR